MASSHNNYVIWGNECSYEEKYQTIKQLTLDLTGDNIDDLPIVQETIRQSEKRNYDITVKKSNVVLIYCTVFEVQYDSTLIEGILQILPSEEMIENLFSEHQTRRVIIIMNCHLLSTNALGVIEKFIKNSSRNTNLLILETQYINFVKQRWYSYNIQIIRCFKEIQHEVIPDWKLQLHTLLDVLQTPLTDKNLHQTFEKLRNEFLKIWISNISNTLFLREFISIIFKSPQIHDSKKKEILRIVCEINVILSKSYYNDILHIEQFLLELYQILLTK